MLVVLLAYGALHAHPHVLFAHELKVGTVVLHARAPFPPNTPELLREVEARLATSALYRADQPHDVFLCDTPALYAFFSPHHPDTGGETYFWLGNVVFLRPVDLTSNRLISPLGTPVEPPRTLVYFITHELVHAQTYDALGLRGYLALERWQEDGYPDFVANPTFDVADARERFRRGDAAFDPQRSGLYLRYQLLVHQALASGLTVDQLLAKPRDAAPFEAELLR